MVTVRACETHVDPINAGGRGHDDADLVPVHTERAVLAVGGLFYRVHRAGRSRLHGPVERESRYHIHGKPDHVHRVFGGLYRAHMLRLHVVGGQQPGGAGSGESLRAGPSDHPGGDQHRAWRVRASAGRQLHIYGVLQDDLPGDPVWRAAWHAPASRAAVTIRTWRVRPVPQLPPAPRCRTPVTASAVQHTAPVAVSAASFNLRGRQTAATHGRRRQAGQGHGSWHVGGVQRERFV